MTECTDTTYVHVQRKAVLSKPEVSLLTHGQFWFGSGRELTFPVTPENEARKLGH
jgi:hypothetical protein